jgi:hypothetical protein
MAAGLGFKDFVTGEVLTAADVDGYLMQGVWVFASATARDAAVTSPQEGNFAYLKDTNVTTYYTGSAWANLDTTGMTNPMTTTGDTIYSSSGSTPARLGIGSTGQVLTVAAGIPSWATPASVGAQFAIFIDQKAQNTNGGTFTSGAFRTRDLNTTQINQITGASIASNQITLAAGTYLLQAAMPAENTDRLSGRLYNITDSTVTIIATDAYTPGDKEVVTNSVMSGVFTIASSKVFEVQQRAETTGSFGIACNTQAEVYTVVTIQKL